MYNKLFTKILDSSIWMESLETRIVWLTFIAAMDEDGYVQFASVENVAHRARVGVEAAAAAIKILEGPDEHSSDPDNEGRRIERVPGGWMVLNSMKYRQLVTRVVIQEQTRSRVKRYREKKRFVTQCNADVTLSNASVTQRNESVTPSEAETRAETKESGAFKRPIYFEPPMPNPTPVPAWEAKAKASWSEHLGGENDYVFGDLVPVVRRYGEDKALAAWEAYCASMATNQGGKFASARAFAQKPGPWLQREPERIVYAHEALRKAREL